MHISEQGDWITVFWFWENLHEPHKLNAHWQQKETCLCCETLWSDSLGFVGTENRPGLPCDHPTVWISQIQVMEAFHKRERQTFSSLCVTIITYSSVKQISAGEVVKNSLTGDSQTFLGGLFYWRRSHGCRGDLWRVIWDSTCRLSSYQCSSRSTVTEIFLQCMPFTYDSHSSLSGSFSLDITE